MTSSTDQPLHTGEIVVDLDAISANVATLTGRAPNSELMAVVKADGYGHGLVPAARAALAGGASWLGVAQLPEALALRAAGIRVPVLSWLFAPGTDLSSLVAADVDLGVSAIWGLDDVRAAARDSGRLARVHLKVDTGLSRAGCLPAQWPQLVEQARAAERGGGVEVVGVWSHLVASDEPGHPSIAAQKTVFADAVTVAEAAGLQPRWRHLANSAAVLTDPGTHYDLVRPGLACYGLTPVPQLGGPQEFGLVPTMTVSAPLTLVKQVPAGQGVSYGYTYHAPHDTTLGLVPLGYADGIPRHAGNGAPVLVAGRRVPVVGRICMDQFVVDLGPSAQVAPGERAVLFGSGAGGEPGAQDWAEAAETISYEIVSRMSSRIVRRYRGGSL